MTTVLLTIRPTYYMQLHTALVQQYLILQAAPSELFCSSSSCSFLFFLVVVVLIFFLFSSNDAMLGMIFFFAAFCFRKLSEFWKLKIKNVQLRHTACIQNTCMALKIGATNLLLFGFASCSFSFGWRFGISIFLVYTGKHGL